jgi:hypothetical protein
MHRQTIYPGQIPLETDLLNTNKNMMVGLGLLAQDILGVSTLAVGFGCVPSGATLNVQINPGRLYSSQNIDSSAYSSLAADTVHQIVKQGILLDAITLACAAPTTTGYSINYLIEATYVDTDTNSVALPYYNASNPTQAYVGPANSGASQPTARQGLVQFTAKPGIAATTGTQTTPTADSGYVGLWVVTVANGQTAITSPNIAQASGAPFVTESLVQKVSQAFTDGRYLQLGNGGVVTGDAKLKSALPYTTSVVNFYGDSITTGVGASITANAWAYLLAARMGWTMGMQAISGCSIMDWIINAYNQTINNDSISVVLPGFNDARYVGGNAAQQAAYKSALYAALAYLAIPDSQKIKANDARVTYAGTWAASGVRSYGKFTNYQSSTATFVVNGSAVYCSVIQQLGNGGIVQVTIDGVNMGSFNLQTSVGNGGAVSTINYMPTLLRFAGLSDGKHTVVLTKTDATDVSNGHAVSIDWVAGSAPLSGGQSKVFVGSTLRMNATGAAGGSPYNRCAPTSPTTGWRSATSRRTGHTTRTTAPRSTATTSTRATWATRRSTWHSCRE